MDRGFRHRRPVLFDAVQRRSAALASCAYALGYKDPSDALKKHVDAEDKLSRQIADSGQRRKMYIINESGLYALIFGSQLETAKKFKRWVTSEVLPQFRKRGVYMLRDWQESKGARMELQYAADWRKKVIYEDDATMEPFFPIVHGHLVRGA